MQISRVILNSEQAKNKNLRIQNGVPWIIRSTGYLFCFIHSRSPQTLATPDHTHSTLSKIQDKPNMSAFPVSKTQDEALLASLRETFQYVGDDFVRGIIEVLGYYDNGRASFDEVAKDIKKAQHSPEFDCDGRTALKLFVGEFIDLLSGFVVFYDERTKEFYI